MTLKLSVGAEIFLALELDKASKLRQRAATLVSRYVMEFHNYGWNPGYEQFAKVCRRFHLGDFAMALQVHYPVKTDRAGYLTLDYVKSWRNR
jgi:hypothetical protein